MNEYTLDLKKVLKTAELKKIELNSKFVGTEHFILSLLKTDNKSSKILNSFNIYYDEYKKHIKKTENNNLKKIIIYSPSFKKIIDNATTFSKENKINSYHVLLSILEDRDTLGTKILEKMNCNLNELYLKIKKNTNIKEKEYLKEIGVNLNALAKEEKLEKAVGREKEIKRMIEILSRKNKNNPLLIGEAGVGKTAIVHELAYYIVNKKVPEKLKDAEIISISMASLVAGTKYRGEFEEKLGKIIKELEGNSNLILFIDEVHTLVGAGGAEGAIDASNILKPALSRGNLKCIGATTIKEYKKFIEKDKALERRFQKIYVEEPDINETTYILKNIKKEYEKFHNVKINNEILSLIPVLSKKYITNRKEPDRSIDILDEVCSKASVNLCNDFCEKLLLKKKVLEQRKKDSLIIEDYLTASKIKKEELEIDKELKKEKKNKIIHVTKEDLKKVLEFKTNMVITELSDNSYNYNKIKKELKKEVIGQDEVINKIIEIIKMRELNINYNKPLSFIFNGSSGAGKTFLAKSLSKNLKYNLIKLDMSDYNNEASINKIVGAAQGYIGYNDVNTVFESVSEKPNSLIILDEFDRASTKVLNLFLNILDEGYLTTSKGDVIDFKNCIFILTTNYLNKENNIGFNKKVKVNSEKFSVEFLNRIDFKLEFNDLNYEDIKKIIYKEIKKITKEDIDLIKIEKIIELSNYKKYGARKVRNLIIKELNKKYIKN